MSRIFTPFGGIGVAMFLLLSGYGLNESYQKNGLERFWSKRFIRLWTPYAIVICILTLIDGHTFKWFVLNICFFHCPFWFIKYIIIWYVIFWFVSRFVPNYRSVILLTVGLVLIFITSGVRGEQAISFPLGVILSDRKIKLDFGEIGINSKFMLGLLVIGIVFLILKQSGWYRELTSAVLINILNIPIKLGIGLFLTLIISRVTFLRGNRFLILSGLISYELYMVHFPYRGLGGDNLTMALIIVFFSYIGSYILYMLNNVSTHYLNIAMRIK